MVDNLKLLVKAAIEDYSMINPKEKIFIALSGGADSVAMLLCLVELNKDLGMNLDISAIHINHNLRGDESNRDENFCKSLCLDMGVVFECERVDVKSYCKREGLTIEEGARKLRYQAFLKIAGEGKIATAHTMSDNAETMLINMVRGSGLKGFCGIPPVRKNIIRPLIYASRSDVIHYLSEKNQEYVTDSSNLSDDYTRNRLRNHVIPVLKQINPSFEKTLKGTKIALEIDEKFLNSEAKKAYDECILPSGNGFSLKLSQFSAALRIRCISMLLRGKNIPVSFDRLTLADNLLFESGSIMLRSEVKLISDKHGLRLVSEVGDEKMLHIPITPNVFINYGGRSFCAKIEYIENLNTTNNVHTNLAYALIDYDKIKGQVFLRSRRDGDRITLCRRQHSSSVKKLLNASIPIEERSKLFFIEDDLGLIFIEKIGVADRVCVSDTTRRVLRIFVDCEAKKADL